MDYSAAANDTDALVGSSPWGSSSPRLNRTPSNPPTSIPDSPISPPRLTSSGSDGLQDIGGFGSSQVQSTAGIGQQNPIVSAFQGNNGSQQQQVGQVGQQQQLVMPPQGQQQQQRPDATRHQSNRQQRPIPQYKLQAKVTALERTGRKDPVIRFDVWTDLPKFRTSQFRDVRRTHSEFVKLEAHLISSNPEAMVPAVPPSVTSAGAGTDEDETRIKNSIQRWLNIVCSNDVLMRDEEMIFFVESDFGYSPVVRMKQPATGVRRKVLKQFAPPPDDTPELHDARPVVKLIYLHSLDAAQKMDKLVKARRALGLGESSLGEKLTTMNVQEIHPGLAHAYRKLGRIIQTCGDYHAAQGTAEATTLGDALNYHSSDAFIVKETLTNRHILLRDLVNAEAARKSKENAVTRMKSSSNVRREKVDDAISALDEAMSQENYLRAKTQRVTSNLLLEKRRWFARTTEDILGSVREYVLREIDAERRTLATLESVRMDIRNIDASGGLSRLGREAHPPVRRISMASSQGVKGDAWSGVPRSREALTRSISGSFVGAVLEGEEGDAAGLAGSGLGTGGAGAGGVGGSTNGDGASRPRSSTGASMASVKEDEDEDRVDARNAASRLAQSTF